MEVYNSQYGVEYMRASVEQWLCPIHAAVVA